MFSTSSEYLFCDLNKFSFVRWHKNRHKEKKNRNSLFQTKRSIKNECNFFTTIQTLEFFVFGTFYFYFYISFVQFHLSESSLISFFHFFFFLSFRFLLVTFVQTENEWRFKACAFCAQVNSFEEFKIIYYILPKKKCIFQFREW